MGCNRNSRAPASAVDAELPIDGTAKPNDVCSVSVRAALPPSANSFAISFATLTRSPALLIAVAKHIRLTGVVAMGTVALSQAHAPGHELDWELRGPRGGDHGAGFEAAGFDGPYNGTYTWIEQAWLSHTEGKVILDLIEAQKLKPGRTLFLRGRREPCKNCRDIMKATSLETGVNIFYEAGGNVWGFSKGLMWKSK